MENTNIDEILITPLSSITLSNKNDNDDEDDYKLKIKNLEDTVLDLSNPLFLRIKAIEFYNKILNEKGDEKGDEKCDENDIIIDNMVDIIRKLCIMYQMSQTNVIKEYLYELAVNAKIPILHKIICAENLCPDIKGYEAVNILCKNLVDVPTPCKVNTILLLIKSPHKKYQMYARDYFCDVIDDITLDCDYRYKTILSLEKHTDNLYHTKESCLVFIKNINNDPYYRILAGQRLLHKCKIRKYRNDVEDILLNFAHNKELDYNLRADAADIILSSGYKENKKKAEDIIKDLSNIDGITRSIFDNAQNVHTKDIEEGVMEMMEYISSVDTLLDNEKKPITFKYVSDKIIKLISEHTKKVDNNFIKKINASLNRIYMDSAVYSKYNYSLKHILVKIWSIIQNNKHCKEMEKRLLEELVDMSGTCSSGFATRLVNTISGFGLVDLKISWKEQIKGNLAGRLNNLIMNIKDPDLQNDILYELTLNSSDYEKRKNFLKFFREVLPNIKEDMYNEFNQNLNDTDFDLYMRMAISCYEGY